MKYNQYAIQNSKGEYIQYLTAYNYKQKYTNSLYDVHLWNNKDEPEKLVDYMTNIEGIEGLSVVAI